MPIKALLMVLIAAFLHSSWNYLTKKSRKKIFFIWWFLLVSIIFYLPMFLFFWPRTTITMSGWYYIIATSLIHGFYFLFLGSAYERGDLSLVYPLSRGSGPLLVPFLALIFINEKLSSLGIFGIASIILGIYVIHLKSFTSHSFLEPFRSMKGSASILAFCTGITIAAYSLVDKVGVGIVSPPVYIYLMFVGTFIFLSPYITYKARTGLGEEWATNKKSILIAGILVLFAYLLVLFAMQVSKVSYVVASREFSIVFSSLYGIVWLKERNRFQKFLGAFLIAIGVAFIGLAN